MLHGRRVAAVFDELLAQGVVVLSQPGSPDEEDSVMRTVESPAGRGFVGYEMQG
jgi:hypothetical protein